MSKERHEFKFVPGQVIRNRKKKKMTLEIDYLDHTRNVYIFTELWVHNLSQFKSYDAVYIEKHFERL